MGWGQNRLGVPRERGNPGVRREPRPSHGNMAGAGDAVRCRRRVSHPRVKGGGEWGPAQGALTVRIRDRRSPRRRLVLGAEGEEGVGGGHQARAVAGLALEPAWRGHFL